jgi:hypothetical protein
LNELAKPFPRVDVSPETKHGAGSESSSGPRRGASRLPSAPRRAIFSLKMDSYFYGGFLCR